ncbi:MAG: CDGSH iron-sulfur domain-containing protein [Planctomycetota bacterium]|nr:CDGSH iron-sulfur domain-containing protein [Planctomycetota bacterium]
MSEPECSQKKPYVVEEEPGAKAWCSCGRTANQPYCDGAHAGTDMRPTIVQIEEKKTVAWCGCRRSGNGPFCDGAHARL